MSPGRQVVAGMPPLGKGRCVEVGMVITALGPSLSPSPPSPTWQVCVCKKAGSAVQCGGKNVRMYTEASKIKRQEGREEVKGRQGGRPVRRGQVTVRETPTMSPPPLSPPLSLSLFLQEVVREGMYTVGMTDER